MEQKIEVRGRPMYIGELNIYSKRAAGTNGERVDTSGPVSGTLDRYEKKNKPELPSSTR